MVQFVDDVVMSDKYVVAVSFGQTAKTVAIGKTCKLLLLLLRQ